MISIEASFNSEVGAVSPAGSKGGLTEPDFRDRLQQIRTPGRHGDVPERHPALPNRKDDNDDATRREELQGAVMLYQAQEILIARRDDRRLTR